MYAPPNALRRTTVTRGTVACAKARTSWAPWRMTPAASWRTPGRNPGVSTSTTNGMRKSSQVRTNRAPFSDACTSSTPPRCRGWFATIPTGAPPMPGEAGHDVARPQGATSRKRAVVHDRAGDVAHVVDLARGLAARARPGRSAARSPGGACGRASAVQVAEQLARQLDGVEVVVDDELADAVALMDARPAERVRS